jgi:hypothetical protein
MSLPGCIRRHFASRRGGYWMVGAAGLLVGLGGLTASLNGQQLPAPIRPQSQSDLEGRQVKLKDQLRVGLKAKTKADIAFIDSVVLKVEQGKLPRKMVDGTFLWARNREKTHPTSHPLRPMVYFQPALTLRAKAIGVKL